MFCQSCGAPNPGDARFCNMCGTRIAPPGTPGGMISDGTVLGVGTESASAASPPAAVAPAAAAPAAAAPAAAAPAAPENVWAQHEAPASASSSYRAAAPPQPIGYAPQGGGPSMSSVSLHGIGVQSSRKTWAMIAGIALLLVALGAVGMWLMMRGDTPTEPVADATPTTPMEIGTPLPEGAEADEVDFVSGGVRVTEGQGATAAGSTARTGAESGEAAAASPTTMRTSGGAGGSTTAMTGGSTTTMAGGSTTAMTGGGAGGESTSEAGSGSGSTGGEAEGGGGAGGAGGETGGGTAGGTVPEGELPEERDIAIEMYAARVRFVIRRYYASRAQTCFDRATRNDPSLRGTVVVRFTIGNEGTVTESSTIRNSTGNGDLGACLANQVRSWRLPAPPGGDLTLEMPFSN